MGHLRVSVSYNMIYLDKADTLHVAVGPTKYIDIFLMTKDPTKYIDFLRVCLRSSARHLERVTKQKFT